MVIACILCKLLCLIFTGDPIDGPFNGPVPPPWSIPIQPDDMFKKYCEVCM